MYTAGRPLRGIKARTDPNSSSGSKVNISYTGRSPESIAIMQDLDKLAEVSEEEYIEEPIHNVTIDTIQEEIEVTDVSPAVTAGSNIISPHSTLLPSVLRSGHNSLK